MSIEISCREYERDDCDNIIELFSTEFARDDRLLMRSYVEWLYELNPFGVATIITAAINKKTVGFLAMIPVVLLRMGLERKAYYVVNVLVDKNFRGNNIFGKMIVTAQHQARLEGALLMGHPNKAAIKSWQRAEMQFRKPLQLHWAIPCFNGFSKYKFYNINVGTEISAFAACYNEESYNTSFYKIYLSSDYLLWRFINHPVTKYNITVMEDAKKCVSLFISKEIMPSIQLCIDVFCLEKYKRYRYCAAPFTTVSLVSRADAYDIGGLYAVPFGKSLPFFCTDTRDAVEMNSTDRLGLSITDF